MELFELKNQRAKIVMRVYDALDQLTQLGHELPAQDMAHTSVELQRLSRAFQKAADALSIVAEKKKST